MDIVSENLAASITYLSNTPFPIKLTISFGIAFAFYYKTRIVKPPSIIGKDGYFKRFIVKTMPVVEEDFAPHPLFFGSGLQTVTSSVLKVAPTIRWTLQEDLDLPDEGQVHLSWLDAASNKEHYTYENRPTVLLLPGLTGNEEANYVRQFAQILQNLGYRTVVFAYRGMGGKGLKTAKTYCACYTDDMVYVVDHIKKKYPEAPLMAVGFSLGAMILFHYLARTGTQSQLLAAMIVSVPWNPFESKKSLTSTFFNRIVFNRYLTRVLLSQLERYLHMFVDVVNAKHVLESNTIHEFDETFTRRVFGFESLDHYYASAMVADKLDLIQVPLLCLNAKDDAFSPGHTIPVNAISETDHITLVLTDRGGHVAFLDTLSLQGYSYMDRIFAQFADAAFKNQHLLTPGTNEH